VLEDVASQQVNAFVQRCKHLQLTKKVDEDVDDRKNKASSNSYENGLNVQDDFSDGNGENGMGFKRRQKSPITNRILNR
jgi:hypothetical protein